MKFPITLAAEARGLARRAGDFVSNDGEKIEYGDSRLFECEDGDGVTQTFAVSQKTIDRVCELDVKKGDLVTIVGNVGEGERGIYLSPITITKGHAAALKAA